MPDPLDDLRRRYSDLSADDLFAIAVTDAYEYRPEAVRIAKEELRRRGVPEAGTAELLERAENRQQERAEIEERPLAIGLKIVCFVFPGVPAFITYAIMTTKGRKRAAREAIVWFGLGTGAWLILGLFFSSV